MASAPAPRSTLISRPDLRFAIARGRRDGAAISVLVYEPQAAPPIPVALAATARSDSRFLVSIRRLGLSQPLDPQLELAALEHLYVLAVEQEPTAAFCLAADDARCDPAAKGETHAAVLKELVEAREHAARASGKPAADWNAVTMSTPASAPGRDGDEVAVRVTLRERPVSAQNVFFSRAPHSGCVAPTDADGVARCRLVDYHGDDGDENERGVPVVATFPGDVTAGRVLVPMTYVLAP